MKAFHGDPTIKAKYLKRLRAHAKSDEIIHGTYWERGKGCAVGCTIHGGDHARYETELGLPEWLAHLEDTLFERLPAPYDKAFPVEFLEAIPVGADLEPVRNKFLLIVQRDNLTLVKSLALNDALKAQVMAAIEGVINYLESGDESLRETAEAAAWADGAAAWAAEAAAGETTIIRFKDALLALLRAAKPAVALQEGGDK